MNGTPRNGKACNLRKTYPGCLGRMLNIFELNIGVSPNRLLADKPHGGGSPVSRSRSDVSRMSTSLDQVEQKVIVSELRNTSSNIKSNGTPIKMLIAQEMSKEVESRCSPPNLVAKLMGLDAFPQQEPEPAIKRRQFEGHARSHSEISMSNWEQKDMFFQYGEPNECKDVHEIWDQPQKFTHMGNHNKTATDKKMALVRQKFVEAKRLSMDEKLRQSKQFQDALEVLSSNKELFLKCLQEPNSEFSQQLYGLQSIPLPPETKRITVLRPSKIADNNNSAGVASNEGKQLKKGAFPQMNGLDETHRKSFPPASSKIYDSPTQPTRIVVLKPNLGKTLDDKAVSSAQSHPARTHGGDFFGGVEDNDNRVSREVAKAITNQMRQTLGRYHRDETVIYSAFPNGYVADGSSFSKSEIEYPSGNLSDSEAMSPVSRHSWDYVNQLGSPFSSSSFSRASYSPESSVCREAKKRLSERWALMSSNGSCQEQRHARRSSSTLGEMLALSEAKKKAPRIPNEESKGPNNIVVSGQGDDENVDNSPRNLTRSKSVPVSSHFGPRVNAENSVSIKGKLEVKEDVKEKSVKSLFKGKVSSLFFSRNKKASLDKFIGSETKDESRSSAGETSSDRTDNPVDEVPGHSSMDLLELSSKASSSGVISPEIQFSISKSVAFGISGENQDQPSPVSVLDPPFELNQRTSRVFPRYVDPGADGYVLPLNPISSNLIDKSPLIGSVARTLSWDDSNIDTASSNPVKEPLTTQDTNEEQEWYFFVKSLLSAAGLHGEVQPDTFFARWHSPQSPLDPSLRDKYINLSDKDTTHEARRRQKRSVQKLVFDCVNAVIVELTGCTSGPGQHAMLDEVWARIDRWFRGECVSGDRGDESGLVVERVVRKEVAGNGWVENLRLERGILGNEIEGDLLEELLEEAVVELSGGL